MHQRCKNQISSKAPIANPTLTGTVNGITKDMVGLGNVDNITDANKQLSIRTQEALDLKAPLASPTFIGTVGGINKSMVGLGNVDNTADADKQIYIIIQEAFDFMANQSDISAKMGGSGTATYLSKFTDTRVLANSCIQENAYNNIVLVCPLITITECALQAHCM